MNDLLTEVLTCDCVLSDSQFVQQPESHLGQMDVNDLLSKLISTGIIKPATTESQTGESLPQITVIYLFMPCYLVFHLAPY